MEHPPPNEPTPVQRKRDFRSWGKRRFILWFGVVKFGGLMFVAMSVSDLLRHHRIDYFDVALNLVIWPLAGYGWGLSMWSMYYDPEDHGK